MFSWTPKQTEDSWWEKTFRKSMWKGDTMQCNVFIINMNIYVYRLQSCILLRATLTSNAEFMITFIRSSTDASTFEPLRAVKNCARCVKYAWDRQHVNRALTDNKYSSFKQLTLLVFIFIDYKRSYRKENKLRPILGHIAK